MERATQGRESNVLSKSNSFSLTGGEGTLLPTIRFPLVRHSQPPSPLPTSLPAFSSVDDKATGCPARGSALGVGLRPRQSWFLPSGPFRSFVGADWPGTQEPTFHGYVSALVVAKCLELWGRVPGA